jgi:hypothetical protein
MAVRLVADMVAQRPAAHMAADGLRCNYMPLVDILSYVCMDHTDMETLEVAGKAAVSRAGLGRGLSLV